MLTQPSLCGGFRGVYACAHACTPARMLLPAANRPAPHARDHSSWSRALCALVLMRQACATRPGSAVIRWETARQPPTRLGAPPPVLHVVRSSRPPPSRQLPIAALIVFPHDPYRDNLCLCFAITLVIVPLMSML